jgi:hypothetical protein
VSFYGSNESSEESGIENPITEKRARAKEWMFFGSHTSKKKVHVVPAEAFTISKLKSVYKVETPLNIRSD